MKLLSFFDTPYQINLCFSEVIEMFEGYAADPQHPDHDRANSLLADIAPFPEFRTGITDESQIHNNLPLLKRLLADFFPAALTMNEIKAVNIPYTHIIFNHTQRFRNILNAAGTEFEINIRDFTASEFYIFSCCMILNTYYGTNLDFGRPLFYDIPTVHGINKHYRILYNGDFISIEPTEKAVTLSEADVKMLLDNYGNLELWKEKFPPESWIMKGFALLTLFDATVENAVSTFKEKLLGLNADDFRESVESIFRSIFLMEDIQVGFTLYNTEQSKFVIADFGREMDSFILSGQDESPAIDVLCAQSYDCLVKDMRYFAVSNTSEFLDKFPASRFVQTFHEQGFKSFIIAPVVKNNLLLGVLEVVSPRNRTLNSINANKLDVVMPFLTDTVERLIAQLQNQVQAVIQEKYTTLHPSVYWKFKAEAERLIHYKQSGNAYALQEIVFDQVFPMYGQIDIKGSSEARNASARHDLQQQVRAILALLGDIAHADPKQTFDNERHELNDYLGELHVPIKPSTEQHIRLILKTTFTRYYGKTWLPNSPGTLLSILLKQIQKQDASTVSGANMRLPFPLRTICSRGLSMRVKKKHKLFFRTIMSALRRTESSITFTWVHPLHPIWHSTFLM